MSDTIRVMNLWKIKSAPVRRSVIVLTFVPLMVANVALAVIGLLLFGWRNQRELFRSAAHYWRTDERITDAPNASFSREPERSGGESAGSDS